MKRVHLRTNGIPLWHANNWVVSPGGIQMGLFEKVNRQIAIRVQHRILGSLYLRDMGDWDPGVEPQG